jgi:hypothetical protein
MTPQGLTDRKKHAQGLAGGMSVETMARRNGQRRANSHKVEKSAGSI